MSKYICSLSIFLLIQIVVARRHRGYRFKLDIGNPNVICPRPNYICGDGQLHYLCKKESHISERCVDYQQIPVTQRFKKTFLLGTNGIRNKIAVDLGISNMNILYWSDEFSTMATRYLRECLREKDRCLIIGERQIKVSQNMAFFRGQVTDRLPARIVRHWFLEFGTDIKNWRDYKKKHLAGEMGNMTNMIYPLSEFMGCSGARMFNGYFFTCYYHPPYNQSLFPQFFANGKPCTNCSNTRKTCSKNFAGLCGIDFELRGKGPLTSISDQLLVMVCLIVLLCKACVPF